MIKKNFISNAIHDFVMKKKEMTYVQRVINWLSGGNKRNDIRTNVLLQILRQLPLLLSPSLLLWFPCQYLFFLVLFSYTISCHKNGWPSNMRLKIIMKKVQIFSSILQTTAGSFFVLSQVNKEMEIRTMYS